MFVILKSDTEKLYQLISYLGGVDELPLEICRRGPWHVVGEGDEARVKPQYRSTLDRVRVAPWSVLERVCSIVTGGVI